MSDLRIEKLSMESTDITHENINKIKELFPQVVTEGKIDFDVLKTILGEHIESQNERYQFTWNGKSETIRFAQKPSTGTLRPDKESSKNWDTTENLYIEGDNLEVLKLLQKTYHNKIKMIYIDPPYNTGGDFVYKDDFKDSIKNYKEQTNQTLRTNPETNGRYHTDWLNMMYSRLMLAKNLLTEDGVIAISLDDKEMVNLRKILDEILGEKNYICNMIRRTINSGKHDTKTIAYFHENLIIYSKDMNNTLFNKKNKTDEEKDSLYPLSDEFEKERGRYYLTQLNKNSIQYSDSLNYPIKGPDNIDIWPGNGFKDKGWCWRWSAEKVKWGLEKGFIDFKIQNGKYKVYTKSYEFVDKDNNPITRTNPYSTLEFTSKNYANFNATPQLQKLFNGKKYFDFPKSVDFIKEIINLVETREGVILDFFSGSSTTAHAVIQMNAEDCGNRKFIMVQLPERTDEKSDAFLDGFNNICEIGKERIRRAGEKIKNELIEKNQKSGILDNLIDPEKLDIGFKVYKLDSSNFNVFDSSSKDIDNIFNHDVFLSDRSQLDILYEVLLKYGVFDKPVEVLNINNKEAYSVAYGHMLVFINQEITEQDITEVVALKPREVIIDERGFKTDNDKMNAVIRLEAAGIEKISTI